MTNAAQTIESLHRALFEHGKNQPGRANHLLDRVLRGLIIAGARFDENDFAFLEGWGVRSCNGSFSPLSQDFYTLAVLWGNVSAAKSWEAAWGWEPWMWNGTATVPGVSVFESRHGYEPRKPPATPRVCGLSVLTIGGKLWRVYDIDKDEIKLAHFPEDDGKAATFTRAGGKRWRIGREEWGKLRAAEAAEKASRVQAADPVDLLPFGQHLDEEIAKHARGGYGPLGAMPRQIRYWYHHHEFDGDTIYERMYALCDSGHALAEYLAWIGLTKSVVEGSADEIRKKYPWKKVEQQIFRFVRECRGLPLRDAPASDGAS